MLKESIRCVVIDDEDYAISLLLEQIKKLPYLEVLKTYSDPIVALAEIRKEDRIDILFLDIDMPELSGIDLASKIRAKVGQIIFTTAYPQYAVQAFEVKAYNYLLKPVDPVKFIEVMNDFYEEFKRLKIVPAPTQHDVLFIKPGGKGKFEGIRLDEIILIQAEHNHIKIITSSTIYTTLESMKNISEYLADDPRFIRIHKTYIINNSKILSLEGNTVKLLRNYSALISGQYREEFMAFIGSRIIKANK